MARGESAADLIRALAQRGIAAADRDSPIQILVTDRHDGPAHGEQTIRATLTCQDIKREFEEAGGRAWSSRRWAYLAGHLADQIATFVRANSDRLRSCALR